MEHTKGELEIKHDPNWRAFECDRFIIKINHPKGLRYDEILALGKANAHHLGKCWNEHDGLQDKADLCDELVEACQKSWDLLQEVAQMNIQPFPFMAVALNNQLRELLAKAEEL